MTPMYVILLISYGTLKNQIYVIFSCLLSKLKIQTMELAEVTGYQILLNDNTKYNICSLFKMQREYISILFIQLAQHIQI